MLLDALFLLLLCEINLIQSNANTHLITVGKVGDAHTSATGGSERGYYAPGLKVVLQEVSVVFILASSYYAMVLTNWVTLQQSYQLSNPKTGTAAMWLQASGQWIALLMYMWALVAPKLFPDRDFGGVR